MGGSGDGGDVKSDRLLGMDDSVEYPVPFVPVVLDLFRPPPPLPPPPLWPLVDEDDDLMEGVSDCESLWCG